MVTILHVSDMQFGVQHGFGRLGLGGADEAFDTLLRRLTDDLDRMRDEQGLMPDLVALTGDLAEWARPKEYADVLRFCEGLRAHLQLAADRLLVIPGNHDVNRDHCQGYFAHCAGNDEAPREPWWPKWGPYTNFFGKLYGAVDRYEFKELAPYTWFELPELKVVVAGLNSTMRESHRDKDPGDPSSIFGHYGYLGEAQLEWFARKLDDAAQKGWLRIGLVHHNAQRNAIDDDENLRDVGMLVDRLGGRLNLLLHGHTHSGTIGWLGRDLPVISTGSAGVKAGQRPEEVPNQYQIVQVGPDGFRCWARQYTPGARKWIGDTRVSPDGSDWRHAHEVQFARTTGTFGTRESRGQPGASPFAVDDDVEEDPHRRAREANDLVAQVMASCRVRDEAGQVQATRVRSKGPWGDHCRISDPSRGTYLLGAHPGPLTRELLDVWCMDIHEPFRSKGNPGQTSDLVVFHAEPLSDALRERARLCGVQLWRRLDYERVIDTERWKKQQLARLDGDREYRRDLYIEQRVTLWSPLDDVIEQVHPAADRLVRMLCEGEEGCFVMVLGPAGTGKTFLLREVARRISERDATITPLVVELRGLDRAQDVYELVSGEFARRKQTLPARAFERDLQDGRIALLFDGFDELAIRVRSAAIPEHFGRILGAARGRARVMVASRAEHFVSHRDAVETLMSRSVTHSAGLAGQLQAITQRRLVATRKFTHEDIEQYLARSLGSAEAGYARMERFRRVHDLPGLAATPRMLAFLVRLTDEQLDHAAARRDAITSAELYRLVIVDHWLAQQEERFNPLGSAPGPTREALLESATRLALHMWRSTAKSIAATDLDAHTGQQLRRLCEDDGDAARQTLQGRTLLTHGERGQFEFVHQTVMEWLVAQALAAELRDGGMSADLEHGRLGEFMVDVLRELLGDEALVAWATRVLTGPTPGNRSAENARIALACMKREVQVQRADLRGQDLRGQSLVGQDLRGALFDGADLRGCDLAGRDLRGASMQGSILEMASLRGADLTGTSLKEANLLYADLSDANLDGADLSGADLSFARLHRARIKDARLTGAVLLGTSFLGVVGPLPAEVVASVEVGEDRALKEQSGLSVCTVVAGSPQGWVVASGHKHGFVTLWDIVRDKLIRVLRVGETIVSLAWSPDGRMLAVAVPGEVMLYRTGGGPETRLGANVRSLSFSRDGGRLAGCGQDGSVSLWTLADAGPPRILQGGERIATSVAWSPDGTMLASGSFDRKVRLWRVDEPGPPIELEGHEGAVVAVAWNPDGTTIASASYDRTVRLWQASDGKLQRVLLGHELAVMGMAWSPDGNAIATHSAREIRVWREPWGESRQFATDSVLISGVAWIADGATVVSGAHDGKVTLWRLEDGTRLSTLGSAYNISSASLTWTDDGSAVAVKSTSEVRVWSVAEAKLLRRLHRGDLLAWSSDGRLASTEWDRIFVWPRAGDSAPRVLLGHTDRINAFAWSPHGDMIASASADGTARVWSATGGEAIWVLDHWRWVVRARPREEKAAEIQRVTCVAFAPGPRLRLATGGANGVVCAWTRTGDWELAMTPKRASVKPIIHVAWRPDGSDLAFASDDGVSLWLGGGDLREVFRGASAKSLAWRPDGRVLGGIIGAELFLWDAASGANLHKVDVGYADRLWWSCDGRYVVLAKDSSYAGSTSLIEAATGRIVKTLKTRTTQGGGMVIVCGDDRYRIYGDVEDSLWHAVDLHRYELGELDELVPGGLQLSVAELLFAVGLGEAPAAAASDDGQPGVS